MNSLPVALARILFVCVAYAVVLIVVPIVALSLFVTVPAWSAAITGPLGIVAGVVAMRRHADWIMGERDDVPPPKGAG